METSTVTAPAPVETQTYNVLVHFTFTAPVGLNPDNLAIGDASGVKLLHLEGRDYAEVPVARVAEYETLFSEIVSDEPAS